MLSVVPERILIGGGVPTRQPQILPLVRRMLLEALAGYGDTGALADRIDTYVAAPALGDLAGPLGSIALALDALAGNTDSMPMPEAA